MGSLRTMGGRHLICIVEHTHGIWLKTILRLSDDQRRSGIRHELSCAGLPAFLIVCRQLRSRFDFAQVVIELVDQLTQSTDAAAVEFHAKPGQVTNLILVGFKRVGD